MVVREISVVSDLTSSLPDHPDLPVMVGEGRAREGMGKQDAGSLTSLTTLTEHIPTSGNVSTTRDGLSRIQAWHSPEHAAAMATWTGPRKWTRPT